MALLLPIAQHNVRRSLCRDEVSIGACIAGDRFSSTGDCPSGMIAVDKGDGTFACLTPSISFSVGDLATMVSSIAAMQELAARLSTAVSLQRVCVRLMIRTARSAC